MIGASWAPSLYTLLLAETDMWATHEGSLAGTIAVAVLAAAGMAAILYYLRYADAPATPEHLPLPSTELEAQRRAIGEARARLDEELQRSDETLRGALAPLLTGPLLHLDDRVEALLMAAAGFETAARDDLRLAERRRRLALELQTEDDAHARALLSASLEDVDHTQRAGEAVERKARLARLELGRLQTLLESLPARVRELGARQTLQQHDPTSVAEIARQLELAVVGTSEALEPVVSPNAHPERTS